MVSLLNSKDVVLKRQYNMDKNAKQILTAQQQMNTVRNRKVNCDEEACLKDRIYTAIRMALAVRAERKVSADDDSYSFGLDGIVNGTAKEILFTLGLEPSYVNIRQLNCTNKPNGGYSQPL